MVEHRRDLRTDSSVDAAERGYGHDAVLVTPRHRLLARPDAEGGDEDVPCRGRAARLHAEHLAGARVLRIEKVEDVLQPRLDAVGRGGEIALLEPIVGDRVDEQVDVGRRRRLSAGMAEGRCLAAIRQVAQVQRYGCLFVVPRRVSGSYQKTYPARRTGGPVLRLSLSSQYFPRR